MALAAVLQRFTPVLCEKSVVSVWKRFPLHTLSVNSDDDDVVCVRDKPHDAENDGELPMFKIDRIIHHTYNQC